MCLLFCFVLFWILCCVVCEKKKKKIVDKKKRSMLSVHSPEVNNNLLRLLHIQREIVVPAPPGQAAHLAPVVCLISVANETHHSRVIRKLNEKVRVV